MRKKINIKIVIHYFTPKIALNKATNILEDGFEVVDWKTGSKKLGDAAAIQLAMYRLAWAKIAGVDVSKVSAAFHYVPTGIDDRRSDLLSEAQLVELLEKH